MRLINALSLSEEGFKVVHDYMDNVYPDGDIKGNPRLTSKKNVMKKVRSAVNRRVDNTFIVKEFVVPPGIPWIEPQTVKFKVVSVCTYPRRMNVHFTVMCFISVCGCCVFSG